MLWWLFLHRHEMLTVIVIGIPERITLRLCEQRGRVSLAWGRFGGVGEIA